MDEVEINARRLPVGIQNFEKLREFNAVYVDKTEYVYKLVHEITPFFLIRPRRFGKSLLLSTLCAYWEGKKELFKGLAIEQLEANNADAWNPYPVFYFDLNGQDYTKPNALEDSLSAHLKMWEQQYGCDASDDSLAIRFRNLLMNAHKQTGRRCVVLVDEYDKPLLDLIDYPAQKDHNKEVFKGFFSNLKSCDAHIRFVFITGVTKFHKISIFSDLNQLNDISLNKEYAALCGITEEELRTCFMPEITALADGQQMDIVECLQTLRKQYDGYHFHQDGPGVYNPYSLLKAFFAKEIGAYWFETGTPTFLTKQLKAMDFDISKLSDKTLYASESMLKDYSIDNPDPIPLLYQTGYLTIADYDPAGREYTLAFPNDEVKYALPFLADQRKVYKIGVSFNSEKRMLSDWKVVEE